MPQVIFESTNRAKRNYEILNQRQLGLNASRTKIFLRVKQVVQVPSQVSEMPGIHLQIPNFLTFLKQMYQCESRK